MNFIIQIANACFEYFQTFNQCILLENTRHTLARTCTHTQKCTTLKVIRNDLKTLVAHATFSGHTCANSFDEDWLRINVA